MWENGDYTNSSITPRSKAKRGSTYLSRMSLEAASVIGKSQKYEKEIESKFSDDLKNELARANRVKLSSITALTMPQLIVSGVDEKPVITRGSLLTGYTEKDMALHTLENRSLQSIKVSGVFKI